MKLDDQRESDNVEDRRGGGMATTGSIGIGTVILALVAWYFGFDPQTVLDASQAVQAPSQAQSRPAGEPPARDEMSIFVRKVLASTEDTWETIFRDGGSQYQKPGLVLFSDATRTACGTGQAAMGPFYCPGDQKVYIDLSFYRDLRDRFHAPGDFAQAYVIAHEVGHHVQKLLGITAKVDGLRGRASEVEMNRASVRLELQADCFAGVWANRAGNLLEKGDLEQGLTAAAAIGDDRLQKESRGRVVPESFTHGTSAQRVKWFRAGFDTGRLKACDTFAAAQL
jgi:predicted metalloprotease